MAYLGDTTSISVISSTAKWLVFALSLLSLCPFLFLLIPLCVSPDPRAILPFPVFLGCIVLLLNACILCLRPTILLDQPSSSILVLAVRSLERGNERARVPYTRLTPSFHPLFFYYFPFSPPLKLVASGVHCLFYSFFIFSAATPQQ